LVDEGFQSTVETPVLAHIPQEKFLLFARIHENEIFIEVDSAML